MKNSDGDEIPGWLITVQIDFSSEDVCLLGEAIGTRDPYPEELQEWIKELVKVKLNELFEQKYGVKIDYEKTA